MCRSTTKYPYICVLITSIAMLVREPKFCGMLHPRLIILRRTFRLLISQLGPFVERNFMLDQNVCEVVITIYREHNRRIGFVKKLATMVRKIDATMRIANATKNSCSICDHCRILWLRYRVLWLHTCVAGWFFTPLHACVAGWAFVKVIRNA